MEPNPKPAPQPESNIYKWPEEEKLIPAFWPYVAIHENGQMIGARLLTKKEISDYYNSDFYRNGGRLNWRRRIPSWEERHSLPELSDDDL